MSGLTYFGPGPLRPPSKNFTKLRIRSIDSLPKKKEWRAIWKRFVRMHPESANRLLGIDFFC